MSTNLDELLPTANAMRKEIALAEGEKACAETRKREDTEAEKKALIDQLGRPVCPTKRALGGAQASSAARSAPA
jgi:hypothetical protein